MVLRYIGIGVLLSTQVSLGIGYIFLLSAVEFFLILIYAGAHAGRFLARKLGVFQPPANRNKEHTN